jgi:putative peptidoglycan lipid II flippase
MSLLRSSLFVGSAGLLSRPLGLLRDVLIAALLGAGPVVDAYVAASRLPDLVRKVLNEGAFNAGFVPLYARLKAERGADTATRFAGEALSGTALLFVGLVALVEFLAGTIVLALASGYAGNAETLALAAACLRLSAPFILFAGLAALLSALLNAERRYVLAALAPLSVNLLLLIAVLALWFEPDMPPQDAALWLAAATGAAGLLQLAIVAAAFVPRPAPLRFARPRLSREVKRLAALGVPAFALSASGPLVLLAALQIASFTPSAMSWLYYAERIVTLPVSFVGAAVSAVLLPSMAAQIAAKDHAGFLAAQNRALEAALLLALPAAAALWVLREPIAAVLFERGAFTRADTQGTAAAIAGLSAGIPFAMAAKVFLQVFFLRRQIRIALLATALAVAVAALASQTLARPLGVLGIGLGAALGLAAQATVLGFVLYRAGSWQPDARLTRRLAGAGAATSVMAFGLSALLGLAGKLPARSPRDALVLAALCLGGLALYVGSAWLLRAVTRDDLAAIRAPAPRLR